MCSSSLLADGLHANLRPVLLLEQMCRFVAFVRDATELKKTMVISHSAYDPQIYASTTKTVNHILNDLQLTRRPVDRQDGIGRRTTEVTAGRLTILGYQGATQADHQRHFQGLEQLMLTGLTISLSP